MRGYHKILKVARTIADLQGHSILIYMIYRKRLPIVHLTNIWGSIDDHGNWNRFGRG